jgi:hypothetical protein
MHIKQNFSLRIHVCRNVHQHFLRVVKDGAALRYIYYLLQHGIVAHRGVYGQFNSNFKPTKLSIEHMKGTGNVPSLHVLYGWYV